MPEWSERTPLRVVTGYHNVARDFFQKQGFEHVVLLSADGALEAAPLMGTADIIFDLVSPLGLLIPGSMYAAAEIRPVCIWPRSCRVLGERRSLAAVDKTLSMRLPKHLN